MPRFPFGTKRPLIARPVCGTQARGTGYAWLRAAALGTLTLMGAAHVLAGVEANTASEAELDSVRGLGPSSTARVLQAREAGPFQNWADFMQRVKGIKAGTAARLSAAGLTVNAQPFVPGPTPTGASAPSPAEASANTVPARP